MNVGTESLQLEDANTVDTVSDSEDSLQHLCRGVHTITSCNTSESPLFCCAHSHSKPGPLHSMAWQTTNFTAFDIVSQVFNLINLDKFELLCRQLHGQVSILSGFCGIGTAQQQHRS